MTRDFGAGTTVTRSSDVWWPPAGRRWDTVVALLRIALGLVFVIPGLKGVVPTLFDFADRDTLVAKFVNPTTGFLAPWLVERITSLGVGVGVVLLVQGLVEIAIGLALILGAGTRPAASAMAMMLMSFTVAAPTAGAIRLARDLALAALCMALIVAGAGRWSLDRRIATARGFTTLAGADLGWRRRLGHRLLGEAALPAARRDDALLAIRLGLAFPLLTSVAFTGGIFDNPHNTTLPLPLAGLLGVLLAAGLAPRFVMAPVALWMLALIFISLTTKGLFAGLDDGKREIGLLAAAIAYLMAGPDRWSWPGPARLRCREAAELLLSYVDGTLEPKQRRAVEEHFADCPDCWRYLGTYRQTVTLGQQLRDESMPAEVYERLESVVHTSLPPADTTYQEDRK